MAKKSVAPKFNQRADAEAWMRERGFTPINPFQWMGKGSKVFVQQELGGYRPEIHPPDRAGGGMNYAAFDTLVEAIDWRTWHGGWVFAAEDGEAIWFAPKFTASPIMNHPALRGRSGKLV